MTGAAPTPGRPEKDNVRAMFDAIAPRYDLLNRVLSARVDVAWRRKAVRALEVKPGDRILDLATGTGDLLLEELSAGAASSVGADLSLGMLRLVRPKFAASGTTRLGSARAMPSVLPFGDACFDGASIAFGIRNVLDRAPGRAGDAPRGQAGRAGGGPRVPRDDRASSARSSVFYFNHILPQIGALVSSRAAYSYLPKSVANFETPEGFGALMRKAGLNDVKSQPLTFGIAWLHVGVA